MKPSPLPLLLAAQANIQSVVEAAYNGTQNSTVPIWPLSTDSQFEFMLTTILSMSNGGGAATSEVLRAASQIVPGDFDSWYDEFNWLGDRVSQLAIQAKTTTSRRGALFRSATYYRMASFFLTGNASDPRLYTSYQNGIDNFQEAISLMAIPGEIFSVPGDGYEIPGYFFKAKDDNNTKLPTIIMCNGYDSNQEQTFHMLGPETLARGYNYVTFEGPGQPTVRRFQGKGFVPDWWHVVAPVIDYLAQRPDVDMDNVALIGLSFGGQLAPLAATREHRLKAVLSVDGMVDIQKSVMSQLPDELAQALNSGNASYFDSVVAYALELDSTDTKVKWGANHGLWAFNTTSYYDWISQLGQYTLAQEGVDNITAYPFVAKGENDELGGGQEATLVDYYANAGVHNATYHLFESDLGAGLHCQPGAEPYLAQVLYDWLDGIFTDGSLGQHP